MVGTLSATNLAAYHHLSCDLYIHTVRHGNPESVRVAPEPIVAPSEISKAQFQRGNDWESTLFSWIDYNGLLSTIMGPPLSARHLESVIMCDERDHFFIAGIWIWPPKEALREVYRKWGSNPVAFGLAKPDLIEIRRQLDGTIHWAVIDAKASKAVKTSHHVQIFFYTMCLELMLPAPAFQNTGEAAIWLPPKDGLDNHPPSWDDLKTINVSLLSNSLNEFFFDKLPKILDQPREYVKWHFNPVCRACPYEPECRARATSEQTIGAMANITLDQAALLRSTLAISRAYGNTAEISDIEDLHMLASDTRRMASLAKAFPATVRKTKRILGLPLRASAEGRTQSALLNAARSGRVEILNRRSFTVPSSEDVAVVLSLIQDPETNTIASFYLSVFSDAWFEPQPVHGSSKELIPALAELINIVLGLTMEDSRPPRTQFYVFSGAEQTTLQSHIIETALNVDPDDEEAQSAVRTCMGALSEGAALLATAFQPLLLSGALLDFLAKKGRTKPELKMVLERLGLSTVGTVEVLRLRIEATVEELKEEGGRSSHNAGEEDRKTELGQLPRVVVLKREIERLLALPAAGFWDLPECAFALVDPAENTSECPSDEEIFSLWKKDTPAFSKAIERRNNMIHDVLSALREIVVPEGLLVNKARVISARFMDLCRQEHIRKLFFMQQFEVLSKLAELWKSRIEGCPDAPILQFRKFKKPCGDTVGIPPPPDMLFELISGSVEAPTDSTRAFYSYLLVEDHDFEGGSVPVEALFDDLVVSGLMFPLNKYTRARWLTQSPVVQENVFVADVKSSGSTVVVLHVWGSGGAKLKLTPEKRYRLSPRLVDFNLNKVLSTLLELDFQAANRAITGENVPFLQLVSDPRAFAINPTILAASKDFLRHEGILQTMFRELHSLGSEAAGALLLKSSQHQAARRILSSRLAICFGPPGTGKTYTIALSILRLFHVQHRLEVPKQQLVFLTAMTHAAIQACMRKLEHLVSCYRSVANLDTKWLDNVHIEHVVEGSKHAKPASDIGSHYIYAGTVYQLYNFSKRFSFEVDLVVIDEAGQLSLASAALVTRSLSSSGRVVIAGDSEQLAPIFTGEYPLLPARLFGSILDCAMFLSREDQQALDSVRDFGTDDTSSGHGTVVQLTENFRLNPDLGEFISTIYPRTFKPQKVQARKLASMLATLANDEIEEDDQITLDAKRFLVSLSSVMLRKPQKTLSPPRQSLGILSAAVVDPLTPHAVSLALIKLRTQTRSSEQIGSEAHIHGEAAIAATLVALLRKSCPNDDIFVATPHRAQRQAVKEALDWDSRGDEESDLADAIADLSINDPRVADLKGVRVDTIERLQGSEASFVICLFSVSKASASTDLNFLLERRRLNVAISRAKTLCILVTSDEVLRPPVSALANEGSAKGYAFLRAFEERAWSGTIDLDLDSLESDNSD